MECREFHNLLLLLWQDLEEKDIPHGTKLHEAIVAAWKSWFITLKSDLAIGVTNQFLESHMTEPFFRKQPVKSTSLPMYGLTVTSVGTLPSRVIGLHGTRPLEVFNSSEHCSFFIASVVAMTESPWQRLLYICCTVPTSRHRYIL